MRLPPAKVAALVAAGRIDPAALERQPRELDLPGPTIRKFLIVQSPPRKYRNVPCEDRDGQKFDSKKECRDYETLCAHFGKENVIRQCSIPIGAKRIRPDFMVIKSRNGNIITVEFMDSKGHATEAWKAKVNHLADAYRIKITLL